MDILILLGCGLALFAGMCGARKDAVEKVLASRPLGYPRDVQRALFAAKLEAWALNYADDRGARYHELTEFISRAERL